jgi:hypothetical protein
MVPLGPERGGERRAPRKLVRELVVVESRSDRNVRGAERSAVRHRFPRPKRLKLTATGEYENGNG